MTQSNFSVGEYGMTDGGPLALSATSQWYAIRTATCREKATAAALGEAGVTVYLPMYTYWGNRPGFTGHTRCESPLLRGYLFVLIEPSDEERVRGIEGVHSFLGYADEEGDNRPLAIPLAAILEMQIDERCGEYDGTRYVKPKYKPKRGDKVKITAGPWLNHIGKVLSTPKKDRAHLMIEGPYGRGTTVQISHLTPVAA